VMYNSLYVLAVGVGLMILGIFLIAVSMSIDTCHQ
jgi:hypothetical protein